MHRYNDNFKDIDAKLVMWWFINDVMNLSVLNVRESTVVLSLRLKTLTSLKSLHTGSILTVIRCSTELRWMLIGQEIQLNLTVALHNAFQFTDILWSLWVTYLWSYSARATLPALYHAKGFNGRASIRSDLPLYINCSNRKSPQFESD